MQRFLKILNYILWITLSLGLVVCLAFTNKARQEQLCSSISINIDSTARLKFITKRQILEQLRLTEGELIGKSFESINLNQIEKTLRDNQYIKNAEVSFSLDGSLNIDILQRRPIVRIENYGSSLAAYNGFYYDSEGNIMPLSNKYSARVPIVTCDSSFKYRIPEFKIKIFKTDTLDKKSILTQIYGLAKYLDNTPFWQAQISQIYINHDYDIELIPRVGDHVILLGNMEDYEKKFENLLLFYTRGINAVGWDNYKEINLKYKNQIVCQKKQ